MITLRHCWWCGLCAEVDTELDESGGMIRDTEASWLCDDAHAVECADRAFADMKAGIPRNQWHDHSQCKPGVSP